MDKNHKFFLIQEEYKAAKYALTLPEVIFPNGKSSHANAKSRMADAAYKMRDMSLDGKFNLDGSFAGFQQ